MDKGLCLNGCESAGEILAVYDEGLGRVGSAYRGMVHSLGLWHRSMHLWVIRSEGHILFQKRSRDKKVCPNLLDVSCAGHFAVYDDGREESVGECAVRELKEELGIDAVYGTGIVPVGTSIDILRHGASINREICHAHFMLNDLKPHEYDLPVAEVEGLVQIPIRDGLLLFSGTRDSARASGVEWDWDKGTWVKVDRLVGPDDFIPRVDSYHYRVFINAERWLAGEKHICI